MQHEELVDVDAVGLNSHLIQAVECTAAVDLPLRYPPLPLPAEKDCALLEPEVFFTVNNDVGLILQSTLLQFKSKPLVSKFIHTSCPYFAVKVKEVFLVKFTLEFAPILTQSNVPEPLLQVELDEVIVNVYILSFWFIVKYT